ncbi:DUF3810 domain-containing protein [Chryseobacterium luquanense]|uniref:DUF3810 domain-containing protein n=1 Tax=Chryseobacterium luquanense TaxID=2983766 RepID=A0ABT3Y6U2_9FLAO|nr:DUF3810 domain-containing protein [Chryseobacterium luquanense]MCX8533879.1 DUF3810 domain-containing protein [Chryseobacterium luquanense]
MHINTTKTYKKKRFWAGILLAQFLLFYTFSKLKFTVSFFETLFELQKKVHQLLFAWIPFSLGDLFYVLLGILLVYLTFKLLKKKNRSSALLRILVVLNISYFIYQIFWGMLYFQTPIITKLPKIDITLEKRKTLALEYLAKAKSTRKLVQEDKNGVFIIKNLKSIQNEILSQQKKLPILITNKQSSNINSFKPSLFKNIMSFTGILGYYNPFTAEAQFNAELPSSYLPFTLAHESSHQLGFAREQEANFIGYLIGVDSKNLELKYSTEYFTLKSLLNSIVYEDEKFVKTALENYSEEMKSDRLNEKKFVTEHQGYVDDFFGFTNNLFLKSNQQEGSITYSYFIDLLVRYKSIKNPKFK